MRHFNKEIAKIYVIKHKNKTSCVVRDLQLYRAIVAEATARASDNFISDLSCVSANSISEII